MTKLNLGHCGICEEEIWQIVSNRAVPNDQYVEFWMHIDDDTIAKHAVCTDCYHSLTDHKVVDIFERIKDTWFEEMVGHATKAEFDHMQAKTVLSWGLSESQVYDHKIDYGKLI